MKSLLSKDEKTKLLETFRSSGQTQAAFAEVNGINTKTLVLFSFSSFQIQYKHLSIKKAHLIDEL